jgi:hypothetical protein
MKTVKEILTANRDSVISSIKYICKVWRNEDVKEKMVNFLAYCEANMNVEQIAQSKRIKTDLKMMVAGMEQAYQDAIKMQKYGTTNPKLADILAYGNDMLGIEYDAAKKDYVKSKI